MKEWFKYLINNKLLEPRDINKIKYAIESLGLILLNVVLLFFISLPMGLLRKTILILFFTYPLRAYTGGYHARTRAVCTILSITLIILSAFMIGKIIGHMSHYSLFTLLTAILAILIYRLSPRVSPNKPMSSDETKNSKNLVRRILIFDLVLYFLLMKFKIIAASILVSFGLVYFLLVLDKVELGI